MGRTENGKRKGFEGCPTAGGSRIVFFEKMNVIFGEIKSIVLFGGQNIMPYLCGFNL